MDYWDIYVPVVKYLCVKDLLMLLVIHGYHSRSIYFVLAFLQAKLEVDVFMKFTLVLSVLVDLENNLS